jgi:hypothetical protein
MLSCPHVRSEPISNAVGGDQHCPLTSPGLVADRLLKTVSANRRAVGSAQGRPGCHQRAHRLHAGNRAAHPV